MMHPPTTFSELLLTDEVYISSFNQDSNNSQTHHNQGRYICHGGIFHEQLQYMFSLCEYSCNLILHNGSLQIWEGIQRECDWMR